MILLYNDLATAESYALTLDDALPISRAGTGVGAGTRAGAGAGSGAGTRAGV